MNILKGSNLESILKVCKIRLDRGLVQLDYKKYADKASEFVLILEFNAPECKTGISASHQVREQIWLLEKEIKIKKLLQKETRYFEFEIIDAHDSRLKLYIPVREFVYTLLHLSNIKQFSLDDLHKTVGLQDNDEISWYWLQGGIKRI